MRQQTKQQQKTERKTRQFLSLTLLRENRESMDVFSPRANRKQQSRFNVAI